MLVLVGLCPNMPSSLEDRNPRGRVNLAAKRTPEVTSLVFVYQGSWDRKSSAWAGDDHGRGRSGQKREQDMPGTPLLGREMLKGCRNIRQEVGIAGGVMSRSISTLTFFASSLQ